MLLGDKTWRHTVLSPRRLQIAATVFYDKVCGEDIDTR